MKSLYGQETNAANHHLVDKGNYRHIWQKFGAEQYPRQ